MILDSQVESNNLPLNQPLTSLFSPASRSYYSSAASFALVARHVWSCATELGRFWSTKVVNVQDGVKGVVYNRCVTFFQSVSGAHNSCLPANCLLVYFANLVQGPDESMLSAGQRLAVPKRGVRWQDPCCTLAPAVCKG